MSNKRAVEVNDLKLIKNYVDEKLKAKSDKYIIADEGIVVGVDLSGKTLKFHTNMTNPAEFWSWDYHTFISSSSGYSIEINSMSPPKIVFKHPDGSEDVLLDATTDGYWLVDELALPDDFGTVTTVDENTGGSLHSSVNDFIQYDVEAGTFDCETNHNRIVEVDAKLDATIKNAAKLISDLEERVEEAEKSVEANSNLIHEFVEFEFTKGTDFGRISFSFDTTCTTEQTRLRDIMEYCVGVNIPVSCSGHVRWESYLSLPISIWFDTSINGVKLRFMCMYDTLSETKEIIIGEADYTMKSHIRKPFFTVS